MARESRNQEYKSLLAKDDGKIEALARIAVAQEETNRILMMFFEKMFSNNVD